MIESDIVDFFIDSLKENFENKDKLGGYPDNVSSALTQLNRQMTIWLGKQESEMNLRNLAMSISRYFGDVCLDLSKRPIREVIPAAQVYNYLVTATEIVTDYFSMQIPEELYWDGEADEVDTPESKTIPQKSKKATVSNNINNSIVEILERIDQKLGILIKMNQG